MKSRFIELEKAVRKGSKKLFEIANACAALQKMSSAINKILSRHVPKNNIEGGPYPKESTSHCEYLGKKSFEDTLSKVKDYSKIVSRNPRILVVKFG